MSIGEDATKIATNPKDSSDISPANIDEAGEVIDASEELEAASEDDATAEEPELAVEASEAVFEPYQKNDAWVIGDIPHHVLDIPLSLGFGKNRQDKRWPAKTMTYNDLITGLSKHVEGSKDGPAFLQGTAVGNERRATAIDALSIMGADVDCGIHPEPFARRVNAMGLSCIVYTTHSHGKTTTFLVENSYLSFCKKNRIEATPNDYDNDAVRRYFLEVKQWESWIVDTIEIGEPAHTGEGKGVWLNHDPMPKFRAIFILKTPYVIAKQAMSQNEAIALWKRKLVGLSDMVGVPLDMATLDPSRLFYLPRHSKGSPFNIWVTGGEALDFAAIPEGNARGGSREQSRDPFMSHGDAMSAKAGPDIVIDGNFSLKKWAATKGKGFDIAKMFRAVAPDKIRADQSETKLTVECPFDRDHSNAGDAEDAGCYVQSPAPELGVNGFTFACSHTACKNRDRLQMVAESVAQGWFTRDDLENDDFQLFVVEETPEEALERLTKVIEALTPDTLDSSLDSLFGSLGSLDISNSRRDSLFEKICEKIGVTKGNAKISLKSRLTPHVKATVAKRQTQKAKKAIREVSGGLPDIDTGSGFNEMLGGAIAALEQKNRGRDAFLFDLDGQKVVIDSDKVKPIGVDEMQAEMRRVATWVVKRDDNFITVDCPRNIATDLHVYRGHATPELERFTRTPAFSSDGKLVVESGYHEDAKVYYSPTPGFVLPDISANPDDEEIKQAVDFVLDNVLRDFPFDDDEDPVTGEERGGASSRAHALALLLLGFMRDMIPGPTPIHLVTKPLPGTGASLLVEALTTIPLGSPVASKVETNDEEERKEMIAFLRKAGLYYWKDNLQRKLQGSTIATAATNKTFSGRLLGQSEDVEFPVRCIFVASGNNVPLADEVGRRCIVIRLDAKRDPKKGRTFKHPRLQQWIDANRPELVAACLTIIQGWISRGMPRWKGEPLASYTAYSEIMGGILDVAGVSGFLGNLDLAQDGANPERDAEIAFASIMWKAYGNVVWSAGGKTKDGTSARDTPVSLIAQNEIDIKLGGYSDEDNVQKLGFWLRKRVGAVWTILDKDGKSPIEVRFDRVRDTHTKQWYYYFEKVTVAHIRAAGAEPYGVDWAAEA